MEKYVEGNDNLFIHIFYEFLTFLYLVHSDCSSNLMLHNIMLDSKKIRIRELSDFFSNSKPKKYEDDVIYTDLITSNIDLRVPLNDDLRKFINKHTAHITLKRGHLDVPTEELKEAIINIIYSINRFIGELDRNIKQEYKQAYQDEEVQLMKQNTLVAILNLAILNADKGVMIKL